ncbi:MAG: hypothetical protein PVI33_04710 [Candidatus Omnitrophota bacterium]|jgi:hypothetical protein
MKSYVLVLLFAVMLLAFTPQQAFAQEEMMAEQEEEFLTEEWLLGDVIAIDSENNQLRVGYIDYDTEEEKEISIQVDVQTGYDNVSSLGEIKINDVVSVDYIADSQGQAIALNIRVDKSEPEVME